MKPLEQRQVQNAGSQQQLSRDAHTKTEAVDAADSPAGGGAGQCNNNSLHHQPCALPSWREPPPQQMQPWPMPHQHHQQQHSNHHSHLPHQQRQYSPGNIQPSQHVQQQCQQPHLRIQQQQEGANQERGWQQQQHPRMSQAATTCQLGVDQKRAVAAVLQGHCVFLSGEPRCSKLVRNNHWWCCGAGLQCAAAQQIECSMRLQAVFCPHAVAAEG